MHKPHDHRAKRIIARALETAGEAGTEVEIALGEAQRADVAFTPDPARDGARAALGLLGRMAGAPCLIEAFHDPPDVDEVLACVRKHLTWAHVSRAPPVEAMPATTWLWILSAGRPQTALRELGCRPLDGWPAGVYEAAPALRTRIVVIPELPREPATLLVRLVGRGVALRNALADLTALPPSAPERDYAFPVLLQLRFDLPDARAAMTEDERINEQLDLFIHQYIRKIVHDGEQRGEQNGRLDELNRLCARRLRRPLSDEESAQLAARLAELGPEPIEELLLDGTPDALAAWLHRRETTPSGGTRIP